MTNPLRMAGLACDIEDGNGRVIYVNLPDGSHLVIGAADELPATLDEVTGWTVTRGHEDNPNFDALVYDSTPDGEHSHHAADIRALLSALAMYLLGLPDDENRASGRHLGDIVMRTKPALSIVTIGVNGQHTPTRRVLSGPFEGTAEAVKDYGWHTHLLQDDGWELAHEQGGEEWPLTVWHRHQQVLVVFLTPAS
ncbi:hypothetical protein BX257_4044 [Streptomyces sp. 3212.3]|uniref:hypothetical protein n=1 Tax=Streptomyces sp. 3212.3 TaxID=1938846 RepID=UPI000E285AF8|nr:hypothetical protein [Streptomyces sp. 3212.3]REE61465.1 hypothetical protein BX257_4044 [Streptomyces sp. 3212.3]